MAMDRSMKHFSRSMTGFSVYRADRGQGRFNFEVSLSDNEAKDLLLDALAIMSLDVSVLDPETAAWIAARDEESK